MTLIISYASAHHVVQVGDRLLTTQEQGQPPVVFDEYANKAIIFRTRDAFVAMGYTGMAVLDGIPMDQWIVEKLTGHTYPRDHKPPAFAHGHWDNWPLLIDMLGTLRNLLGNVVHRIVLPERRTQWRRDTFEIVVSGWQWNRLQHWPFVAVLKKGKWNTRFLLEQSALNDYRRSSRHISMTAIGNEQASAPHLDSLSQNLFQPLDPLRIEEYMVGTIRKVAAENDTVGPNCTCIHLYPPNVGMANVFYRAVAPAEAEVSDGRSVQRVNVAFTPWVVGPELIHAPSSLTRDFFVQAENYRVNLVGPDNPNFSGIISGLPRPTFN